MVVCNIVKMSLFYFNVELYCLHKLILEHVKKDQQLCDSEFQLVSLFHPCIDLIVTSQFLVVEGTAVPGENQSYPKSLAIIPYALARILSQAELW